MPATSASLPPEVRPVTHPPYSPQVSAAPAQPAGPGPAAVTAHDPPAVTAHDIEDEPTSLGFILSGELVGSGSAEAKDVAVTPDSASPDSVDCPQCGETNPRSNRFCAACGFKLQAAVASALPVVTAHPPAGTTLTVLRADGSEAGSYVLPSDTVTVGRETGGVFSGDMYLSPKHAIFSRRGVKVWVRDAGSLNGVYRRLRRDQPVELGDGDVFRIGQEILRLELPRSPLTDGQGVRILGSVADDQIARLALVTGRDSLMAGGPTLAAFPVLQSGIHMGRERGDLLFPEDGYVSGLHCRLAVEEGRFWLTDTGSSNGTFVRVRDEAELESGDIVLMGQQLFRINFS